MPFFEKCENVAMEGAMMYDIGKDLNANTNNDNRRGGHSFNGATNYRAQKDNYGGNFNGGNFGGNGMGGQGNKNRIEKQMEVWLEEKDIPATRPRGGNATPQGSNPDPDISSQEANPIMICCELREMINELEEQHARKIKKMKDMLDKALQSMLDKSV